MKKLLIACRVALFAALILSVPAYSNGANEAKEIKKENSKVIAYDPSGTWVAEVEVPGQTVELIITISKDDDGDFEVSMEDTTDNETVEMEDISFDEEEMTMTGEVDADGTTIEVELEFDEDEISGTLKAEGLEMKLTGEREN
ncbi:hypothetical protein [Roseivirga misakiensis]|uniref:Lipocalin-like domain-containing protein n=1 Tax=Roseivirga misakiensis TaxID=1563681 RepID=A0A1E5SZ65_9BACT|nr:hypothetical protein [Roseivirga misakiensis]OEK04423.1 hypothetical protein BFP71_13170 [Roseivirga misakiensis]